MPSPSLHAAFARVLIALTTIAASLTAFPAQAGRLADVGIRDRTTGEDLPVYRHRGRLYVAGEPGHEYEVRVVNRGAGRILAVGSVDGVNVVSGETADAGQSGYVLAGYDTLSIDGWRKSLDEVAAFYFTSLPDSYAARTGRPGEVGVIGVAIFREKAAPRAWLPMPGATDEPSAGVVPAPAPSASADAASAAEAPSRQSEKLGTGHGARHDSAAQHVDFERASARPDEVIAIYYDSRRNLVAQGVIRPTPRYAERRPNPFPGGFVPDP